MGKRKGKSKKRGGGGGGNLVNVSGPGGFVLRFPIPRLPTWLGAASRLSANATVYPRVDLDLPIILQNVVVAAGAVASVIAIDPNVLVSAWNSRVANLFREYCVVGLRVEMSLTATSSAQGAVLVFIDETLATAPNAGSAYVPHVEVPLVAYPGADQIQLLSYKPSGSYTDLVWVPTTATAAKQWLKFYASNATTATAAGTTATILVRGTIALCFRGYSNF